MAITILQVVAGLALLFVGGDGLVRGASALAFRVGMSPLAVGLTIVAFGTSAPELVVSVDAVMSGANDISIGNVVGSNIANIALILGLAALIRPIASRSKIVRFDAPIVVVVSLGLLGILANGSASRLEGGILLLGMLSYVVFTYRQARLEAATVKVVLSAIVPVKQVPTVGCVFLIVAGLMFLIVGGHLLVAAAVGLAAGLGVSEAVIGLTIVAVGTSLPELATSLMASLRGQGDIAIGNVIGSNIFNVLGILGVTALVRPLQMGGVSWLDLGVMTFLAIALIPLLLTRARLDRLEGAVLVAIFFAFTIYLLAAQ